MAKATLAVSCFAERQMEVTGKIVMGCWIVVIAFCIVSAFFVKRTRARQPLLQRLFYLVLTAVAVLLINASARRVNLDRAVLPHTLVTGIVADLLALVGLSIAIWARATFGGNWSARVTLKENHELIQRGPYRLVRHPIYSGLLLMVLGTAIQAGRVGAFIALVVCSCGFWVKLRQEERLLAQHLSGYSDYMRRTKALVPFIL
jgi:protein-S-isoprenylcysteine O-methyltransferase Ste14